MNLAALAQQVTDILAPALPLIYASVADKSKDMLLDGGKAVVDKSKDMLLEKCIEKLGYEGGKRAKALLDRIHQKKSEDVEKAFLKVSENYESLEAKEKLQQEILKLLMKSPDLVREIELIVNINFNIDLVKQLSFGDNNLILTLEDIKGEELIKIREYMDWKRQEELKQEVQRRYSLSVLPDYPETLIKIVTENRAEELARSLKHLHENKILFFSGIAGIGKTTLARVLINFRPIGIPEPFWLSFYHNRDANLENVLEALAAYLKAPELLSFKGQRHVGNSDINMLTEKLREKPFWLVFDDLSYVINEKRTFIDPGLGILFTSLRDNNHRAKVILTSRIMPMLENGEYLIDELEDENKQQIKGIKPNFAVNYLRENGFENIEIKTLESLVENVGGHPFSLKLLVRLVKKYRAEDILKNLSLYKKHQKDRIKNARFLFGKLVEGEKELLERIAVYRQPETFEAIQEMFTDSTPEDSIDTLIDKSLLEIDNNGKYWLHPLVQEFSYDDLKNKKEVHLLAVKYYLSSPLPKNPVRKEDLQPVIEAYHHACKAEEYDLAVKIICGYDLPNLLHLWGNPRTMIEIYKNLLPKDHFKDEPILKNKIDQMTVLGNLGLAYLDIGDPKKAIEYEEQALGITRKIDDRRSEGGLLGNLGSVYFSMGDLKKAIEYYDQALTVHREIDDRHGKSGTLGNLGSVYRILGEPKKAIEYNKQALTIAREIGNRRSEGDLLGNLGSAYFSMGETKKAIEYYNQALKIARDIGDRCNEGIWLGNLGNAYCDLGEPNKAIDYHEQALHIARETDNRYGEGNRLGSMGSAYRIMGKTKKAIEYQEQALKIAREIGDRRNEGNWLADLGLVYHDLGETKKAIEYYKQALKIAREIGNRNGEGDCLGNMGNAYRDLGETKKAIEYYKQTQKIKIIIGNRNGEGDCLRNIGNAYLDLDETKKAIEYYEQALKIAREVGNRHIERNLLGILGFLYLDLGDPKKAIECYEYVLRIMRIIRDVGDRRREGFWLGCLGLAYLDLGETKKAIEYYNQASKIAREIDDKSEESNWLGYLGLAYLDLGETKKAIEYYNQASKIAKSIEDQSLIDFWEQKLKELEGSNKSYLTSFSN